jgi:hypothetical protein
MSGRRTSQSNPNFTYAWIVKNPSRLANAANAHAANNRDPHRMYVFKSLPNGQMLPYIPNYAIYNRLTGRNATGNAFKRILRTNRGTPARRAANRETVTTAIRSLGIPPKYVYIMSKNILNAREKVQQNHVRALTQRGRHPRNNQAWRSHQQKIREWALIKQLVQGNSPRNNTYRQPSRNTNNAIYRYLSQQKSRIPSYHGRR